MSREARLEARLGGLVFAAPLAAAALLLFTRLNCPLLEPEETRYAEIPRQMLLAGSFVTPVWHGEPYWHKPPLFYWLVMASYRVFGVHDWAARLVPCLAAFATVVVVYTWAWRMAGKAAALCSATVLVLSARFLYQGRMVTLDSLLALWVTLGLAAGHVALSGERLRWGWWLVSAVAVGLGVLSKGPVAVVLVLGPLGLWWLRRGQVARPGWRQGLGFVAVVLAVAGPWYAAAVVRDAEAAGEFFWLHNLQRYLSPFDHAEPIWFFVPILLLGTLPWSLLAVPLTVNLARRLRGGGFQTCQPDGRFPNLPHVQPPFGFALLSFASGFLFLSASGCKRAGYIAPLLPLWAMLLGTFLAEALKSKATRVRWCSPALVLATTTTLAAATALVAAAVGVWSWPVASCVAAGVVFVGAILVHRGRRLSPIGSWGLCAAAVFVVLLVGVVDLLPQYHRRFALRGQVRRHAEEAAVLPVACYPRRWDSISFYLERNDVRAFAQAEREALMAALLENEGTLVFIKSRGFLAEFLQALPPALEFVPCARQGPNVTSGFVCRKNKDLRRAEVRSRSQDNVISLLPGSRERDTQAKASSD